MPRGERCTSREIWLLESRWISLRVRASTCLPYNTGHLLETFDICGNDPYPVYHDGKKDLYKAWHWPQLSRQLTCRSRGLWQVPQAFSWANYQKLAEVKGEARAPTFDLRLPSYGVALVAAD